MNIKSILILLVLAFTLNACTSPTNEKGKEQPTQWPDAQTINQKIGRGINLGNALEAPNEGDWGVVLQPDYFKAIAQAGFNSVRIPIRWSNHALADSPYTIDRTFFERVDWAIDQAERNNLLAIINIHHYEEIFEQPEAQKTRFLALWQQIGHRYKNKPPELIFEILNEPHDRLTPQLWNEYAKLALQVIRKENPKRAVIVGTANWGGTGALNQLQLPDDSLLILTFHYYSPFHFTHQGASWVEGSDAWLGTKWSGTSQERQAVQKDFDQVNNWAVAHHIPVFMGEFGAYSKADMDSRVRWTSFVAREAEKRGFSWAYWEFCSGFGVYDPQTNKWRNALLQALIPGN